MKNKANSNSQLWSYKKTNNSHKFHQNNCNSGQFPAGNLSFQASQQIKPGDHISLSVSIMKHFTGRIGEKYTLQKKSKTSLDAPISQAVTVNEVTETITHDRSQADTGELAHKAADEEDLRNLFNQYSDLMSSNLD